MDGQTLSLKSYNSDTRKVSKHGRSLAEGSSALGRLLIGGATCGSAGCAKAQTSAKEKALRNAYKAFPRAYCYCFNRVEHLFTRNYSKCPIFTRHPGDLSPLASGGYFDLSVTLTTLIPSTPILLSSAS